MSQKLYLSLAWQNLRRNRQSYLPYMLSCTGLVMMYYIIRVLERNLSMGLVYGGRTIGRTLMFGQWVMVLFIIIFLFYTHGFLIKRRRKEFGLFNILGMEKKHIGRVLALETLFSGLITTALGIALGALMSRLFHLILLRALSADSAVPLSFVREDMLITLLLFAGMHLLTLIKSLAQLHLSQPIKLLVSGRQGEREPKARWLLALLGLGSLGAGYWLSLSTTALSEESLRTGSPISSFFIAVLLVIIGTYLLFMAGSVAVLKLMKANKRFYYHPTHFGVIGGLMHRMQRNAVGLASICILSTMVLVMVSATTSLFVGREDLLGRIYAHDAMISLSARELPDNFDEMAIDSLRQTAAEPGGSLHELSHYRQFAINVLALPGQAGYASERAVQQSGIVEQGALRLQLVPAEDYQRYHPDTQLQAGQGLAYAVDQQRLPESTAINGHQLSITMSQERLAPLDSFLTLGTSGFTLVLPEADIAAIVSLAPEAADHAGMPLSYTHVYAFDHQGLDNQGVAHLMDKGQSRLAALVDMGRPSEGNWLNTYSRSKVLDRIDLNAVYGGLLFVSVLLGGLFIMAMVLIIYYKQVSEGYEDQQSYAILQQVGMSLSEVRRSISLQVLMVFFLPLITAGLHLLMSQRITLVVLQLLAMGNQRLLTLLSLITYLLFALFYTLVYLKTTQSYYRIVRAGNAQGR